MKHHAEAVEIRCPACDATVYPDESYCEACGHALGVVEARGACVECGSTVISADGYCEKCGMRQPSGRDHIEITSTAGCGVSDRGRRHSRNEDAMALASVGGARPRVVAVVSDGVSSSPRPEDASQTAVRAGLDALTTALAAGEDAAQATHAAVLRAAEAVADLAESTANAPACTYVSAVVDTESVTVGWVGDSRAYWLGLDDGRPSAALTRDDAWTARMEEAGLVNEAMARRMAHVLTGWLGADAGAVDVHVATFAPGGRGAIVVCSDGLWNYLPEAEALAAAAPRAADDPLETARGLVRHALDCGGRDNITVVVIPFPPSEPTTEQPT